MTLKKYLSLKKNKSLTIFHVNACSLNKKFNDLQHLLSSTKKLFDVIAVSETRITKYLYLVNLILISILLNLLQLRLLQVVPLFTLPIIYRINVVMT